MAAVEATLASELPVLRAETAAARALAAGADRDVSDYRSELRSHTRMLNALRETQVEQYRELLGTQVANYRELLGTQVANYRELRGTQVELRETQVELRETQMAHYAEHKADSAEIKAGLGQIVRMLEGLGGSGS